MFKEFKNREFYRAMLMLHLQNLWNDHFICNSDLVLADSSTQNKTRPLEQIQDHPRKNLQFRITIVTPHLASLR